MWCFRAWGPPGGVASRHFQDCKRGPCPSLTLQGPALALFQMHTSIQGQGDLPTQSPYSLLLKTPLGPQDHRIPCSGSTEPASRACSGFFLRSTRQGADCVYRGHAPIPWGMVEKQLFWGLLMDLVTRTRVSAHMDASPLVVYVGADSERRNGGRWVRRWLPHTSWSGVEIWSSTINHSLWVIMKVYLSG